jgi:formylglycine-generating enzyme required for sulfatase activity
MKGMKKVLLALAFAALPGGSMLIASCSGTDNTTDGGTSKLTTGCSTDLSDKTAVGTYVSNGKSWVLGDDCSACLGAGGSQGDTWSSSFTSSRDAIRIDVTHADGTAGSTFYLRNGGQSLEVARDATAVRDVTQVLACGASHGSYATKVGGLEWSRAMPSQRMTWDQAQRYCSGLTLGSGGWRLPTRDEWLEIATRFTDQRVFGEDGWFWSSTAGETSDTAWAVTTAGAINANQTSTSAFVRCVR